MMSYNLSELEAEPDVLQLDSDVLLNTQVAHAERALSVWRAAAEELGASPEEWTNAPSPGAAASPAAAGGSTP